MSILRYSVKGSLIPSDNGDVVFYEDFIKLDKIELPRVLDYIRRHSDELIEGIKSEHRTHQQSIIGSMKKIIVEYGKTSYFDLRNEASVKWAKTIEAGGFPFL